MAGSRQEEQAALDRDLGLGGRIADQQRSRMLNRDGTFNVKRAGLPGWGVEDLYHRVLTITWLQFSALVTLSYLGANLVFGVAYFLCGPGALAGGDASTAAGRFADCFFFSVQTFGTIGYGRLTPNNLGANLVVTVEALVGLMSAALGTSVLFARFSRPAARLLFSDNALIAPFGGGRALMFRVMNARLASELTEVTATVTLGRMEERDGRRVRRFFQLPLERARVVFLPMQWVVVHPIDEASPLWGLTEAEARRDEWEFLILISGIDETFTQMVHTRSSYRHEEIVWEARFVDMYRPSVDGSVEVDASKLSEYQRL